MIIIDGIVILGVFVVGALFGFTTFALFKAASDDDDLNGRDEP